MARMIPPGFSNTTPAGERELFNKLRTDPDTNGWVVLHSLDIKKHRTKIEGELDMLVIVPSMGILCIEVKGCSVSRRDGNWFYPYEVSPEGPFKQASKAMHSLRDYVSKKDPSLSNLLYFSAVVFTKADFKEESPEWHPWQYISRLKFLRRPISQSLTEILQRAHAHMKTMWSRHPWYDDTKTRPTEEQISRLVRILRDEFEYLVSPRHDIEQLEQRIREFTEEQFAALDLLEQNSRVIFKGPAGTGKTVLALEAARRASSRGMRVLLVCYNKLLGDWLAGQAKEIEATTSAITCGTFHSILRYLVEESPPHNAPQDYWQTQLPVSAADRLLEGGSDILPFDMLIVDEAQDLVADEYLDVMDLLLIGGLAGGHWALFGDFERQAIYASDNRAGVSNALAGLGARSSSHVNFALRINCRNAEPIAHTFSITSGLTPGYRKFLHDMEGGDVQPLFYTSQSTQVIRLKSAIDELLQRFAPSEIVILSMLNDENSCARVAADALPGISLAPLRQMKNLTSIAFASIHAFKGLESSAVVITDVNDLDAERSQALLYVGMSRARAQLYMLMDEKCRPSYDRMLDVGLEKTSRK
jgi:ATP:corrinoid adenosyltransferase